MCENLRILVIIYNVNGIFRMIDIILDYNLVVVFSMSFFKSIDLFLIKLICFF